MDKPDIPFLSATELSKLIESKEVSPVEATEAYLDRIDDMDFKFNSYITVSRKEALEAAQKAEQEIAGGNYLGPMHGIPVAVKDQFWSKGVRTTGGSPILSDFVPDEDATVVANLKKAGAVLLGKLNMTEFAMTRFNHRFSQPHNPWGLDRETGASSSGSGAATAAYLCASSLGEDTGGSIRAPASCCGIVGLLPSYGRVSRYGVLGAVWSMDTVGPISRTVEDAAITLGAIAGHDPKDKYTWNVPVPDFQKALTGDIRGLRVGILAEQVYTDLVDEDVRQAVIKATTVLGELGASVEEVTLPLIRHEILRWANIIQRVHMCVESAPHHRDRLEERLRDYGNDIKTILLVGSILPAQAYYKAQKLKNMMRQQVNQALERFDVLALPTTRQAAQPIEADLPIASKQSALQPPYLMTQIFSVAGDPSISVPCGFSSDGLPIGLQLGGRPGEEETVLKVAHAYEQNTPWHTMRPPNV